MKMLFKKVTHVIFDMDGLLIESESVYDKIMNDIAAVYGKEYTTDIRVKVLGTPEKDTARIAVTEMGLPISPEEFLIIYKEKVHKELQNPVLMPGAKELVKHFYKNEIPIAVATSSSQDSMELKTKNHQDIFKLFHHIVCGSTDPEVKHGKPAPDIFLVCASRFPDKPHPSQCLVLEDAPNGVRGAIAAGMQAVMVPSPDVGEELRKPATLVLQSLEDFKPEQFGLPAWE
ncbi:probable pseudouridine-5'-phosphatase isoform X2 [Anoplophora glabripennis]|uniref:probable pseudouridine-5'-phosphatase isoform X1 n=1 Tax=Anoplophora glabripennis TaxID=217634 RepID=UPI000C75D286|nr:probable pseudouridine-5'-phosphatase isoform X1 [Anoplophora glabripennis]XP_023310527.1 probable pseudouridine-5'-phosphatase isoform X2 [Anoplophora glabripennis]